MVLCSILPPQPRSGKVGRLVLSAPPRFEGRSAPAYQGQHQIRIVKVGFCTIQAYANLQKEDSRQERGGVGIEVLSSRHSSGRRDNQSANQQDERERAKEIIKLGWAVRLDGRRSTLKQSASISLLPAASDLRCFKRRTEAWWTILFVAGRPQGERGVQEGRAPSRRLVASSAWSAKQGLT